MSHARRRYVAVLVYGLAAVILSLRSMAQERRPVESPPVSRLSGRVADAESKPLSGVRVVLRAVDGAWAEGLVQQEFETRTRADGSFAIEVRTPTCDWVSLFVEPDPFHDVAGRDFGPAGGRDQPRIAVGENALGTFTLGSTGAISGRVLDTERRPITGAEVRLAGVFPGGYGRGARSDASGVFTIPHVPPGSYTTEALRDGYQLTKGPEVNVSANATVAAGDFLLAVAPTISGLVVDSEGQPVADARITGHAVRMGTSRMSYARSDASGRFSLALFHECAHSLEVEAEGFREYDEHMWDRREPHPMGASDVRIVLTPEVRTTFLVCDADGGAPVRDFSVTLSLREIVTEDGGMLHSGWEETLLAVDRDDGRFTCAADPSRHLVRIEAPGFAPLELAVQHDAGGGAVQTVRLTRGASLSGRVLHRGQPVVGALVRVYAESLVRYDESEGGAPFDEDDWYWMEIDGPISPDDAIGAPRLLRSGADGRFEIGSLERGEIRVEIVTELGARRVIDPLAVDPAKPTDLGDIELLEGCSLRGRVIVPGGTSARGVRLTLWNRGRAEDRWRRAEHAVADEDGKFVFEHLTAGRQHLFVDDTPGVLTASPEFTYELAPGEQREVVLDVSHLSGCHVAAVLRIDGAPAPGFDVALVAREPERWTHGPGRTAADGRASNWCRVVGLCDVVATSSVGLPVAMLRGGADLVAGPPIELVLDANPGKLLLEWPACASGKPAEYVAIEADVSEPFQRHFRAHLSTEWPNASVRMLSATRCELSHLMPGTYECLFVVSDRGSFSWGEVPNYRKRFTIRAGETAECALTERDLVPEER